MVIPSREAPRSLAPGEVEGGGRVQSQPHRGVQQCPASPLPLLASRQVPQAEAASEGWGC